MPKAIPAVLRTTFARIHWKPFCWKTSRAMCSSVVQDSRRKVVVREAIQTCCECRGHTRARSTEPKDPSHPEGYDPVEHGKGKHGKGKFKRGAMTASAARTRTRRRTRTQSNVGTAESAVTARRIVGAERTKPLKVVQRERTRTRAQRMLTISTRQNQPTVCQKSKSVDSA